MMFHSISLFRMNKNISSKTRIHFISQQQLLFQYFNTSIIGPCRRRICCCNYNNNNYNNSANTNGFFGSSRRTTCTTTNSTSSRNTEHHYNNNSSSLLQHLVVAVVIQRIRWSNRRIPYQYGHSYHFTTTLHDNINNNNNNNKSTNNDIAGCSNSSILVVQYPVSSLSLSSSSSSVVSYVQQQHGTTPTSSSSNSTDHDTNDNDNDNNNNNNHESTMTNKNTVVPNQYGTKSIIWCDTNKSNYTIMNTTTTSTGCWTKQQQQKKQQPIETNLKKDPINIISTTTNWKTNISKNNNNILLLLQQFIYTNIIQHFIPISIKQLQYPGYYHYAYYTFIANIAGSASFILSTQILLSTIMLQSGGGSSSNTIIDDSTISNSTISSSLSSSTTTAISAGALNWMIKDGIGQLGGIIVTSYMGQKNAYDTYPKQYRIVAAMILDLAAMIEITTPLLLLSVHVYHPNLSIYLVMCMACLSTILKNIGYIMVSACRATIHQSLCISNIEQQQQSLHGTSSAHTTATTTTTTTTPFTNPNYNTSYNNNNNLADVTAKFASQSTAASVLGTMIGIGFTSSSTIILSKYILPYFSNHEFDFIVQQQLQPIQLYYYYMIGFLCFVGIHQSCNYMALRHVTLHHLNRQRLSFVCNHYAMLLLQRERERELYVSNNNENDGCGDNSSNGSSDIGSTRSDPSMVTKSATIYDILTPKQVADIENYFPNPLLRWNENRQYNSTDWLMIGCPLPVICPNGSQQLIQLLNACPNEQYIINIEGASRQQLDGSMMCPRIQLVFLESATKDDLIRGMLHAHILYHTMKMKYTSSNNGYPNSNMNFISNNNNRNEEEIVLNMIYQSHNILQSTYESFQQQLHLVGWYTNTLNIEDDSDSFRFAIKKTHNDSSSN